MITKSIKDIALYFLPYKFIESYRAKSLRDYHTGLMKEFDQNPIPFTLGYLESRSEFIHRFITSESFKTSCLNDSGISLPEKFGLLFDERVVEYPWILSQIYKKLPSRLLDVGPVLNYDFCVEDIKKTLPEMEITMLSITPDARCYYDRSISYLISDIRYSGIRDGHFDCITCISTLEHIGMDNTKYGAKKEFRKDDYIVAVQEMLRILAPGGSLLITVPFGKYGLDLRGSQQRFDQEMLANISKISSDCKCDYSFFKYIPSYGWIVSNQLDCASAVYNSENFDSVDKYSNVSVRAESVACITITKNFTDN